MGADPNTRHHELCARHRAGVDAERQLERRITSQAGVAEENVVTAKRQ